MPLPRFVLHYARNSSAARTGKSSQNSPQHRGRGRIESSRGGATNPAGRRNYRGAQSGSRPRSKSDAGKGPAAAQSAESAELKCLPRGLKGARASRLPKEKCFRARPFDSLERRAAARKKPENGRPLGGGFSRRSRGSCRTPGFWRAMNI